MSELKGSLKGALKSENHPNRLICFVILAGYIPSSYTTFHQSFQTKKGAEMFGLGVDPAPDNDF